MSFVHAIDSGLGTAFPENLRIFRAEMLQGVIFDAHVVKNHDYMGYICH